MKTLKLILAAAALAFTAGVASAATVMTDGGTYDISSDDEFNYTNFTSDADAADDAFTFQFESGGTAGALAFNLFLDQINFDITSVTLTWSSEMNGNGAVYATTTDNTPASGELYSLGTLFSAGDPQWFTVSWTSSGDGDNALVSIEVAAIPVPAAGLMLLGALGGLVGLRRRKKA